MDDTLQLTTPEQTEVAVQPADRAQVVLRKAWVLYEQAPDWTTFFREILGVDGIVRKMFPTLKELQAFEQEPEFTQIQQLLAKLRDRKEEVSGELEPTRVITVRLPKSVHEYLKAEAHDRHTSMNKLCISKLLQMIDMDLVPSD